MSLPVAIRGMILVGVVSVLVLTVATAATLSQTPRWAPFYALALVAWIIVGQVAYLLYLYRMSIRANAIHGLEQPYHYTTTPDRKLVTLFAHGLGASPAVGYFFTNGDVIDATTRKSAATTSLLTFGHWWGSRVVRIPTFPNMHAVRVSSRLNIGEGEDARLFADEVVASIEREDASTRFILLGHSRGAATVFNAMCILATRDTWATAIRPRIHAVVCMGLFSNVADVLAFRYGRSIGGIVQWVLHRFFHHAVGEPWSPLKQVDNFPLDGVELTLLWSRVDTVVPAASSKQVYDALVRRATEMNVAHPTAIVLEEAPHDIPFARGDDHHKVTAALLRLCLTTTSTTCPPQADRPVPSRSQ